MELYDPLSTFGNHLMNLKKSWTLDLWLLTAIKNLWGHPYLVKQAWLFYLHKLEGQEWKGKHGFKRQFKNFFFTFLALLWTSTKMYYANVSTPLSLATFCINAIPVMPFRDDGTEHNNTQHNNVNTHHNYTVLNQTQR